MSMNADVEAAVNRQINNELGSYYNYLAMAAYFESGPFPGFGHWMRLQAQEEQEHAMKLFDYLIDRGGKVVLEAIPTPTADFDSPLDVFQASLTQEKTVTNQINDLYAVAQKEGDFATMNFLGWFLDEQVEEEKTVGEMVDRLKVAGDNAEALFLLEREAAARTPEADEDESGT